MPGWREIKGRPCLLIFDPHQDVAWMRSVIEREKSRVDHVLLGGDYRKTRYRGRAKNGYQLHTLFALANVVIGARPVAA